MINKIAIDLGYSADKILRFETSSFLFFMLRFSGLTEINEKLIYFSFAHFVTSTKRKKCVI